MLRYLYAADLENHAQLRTGMFQDRRAQFQVRQGWEVTVNARGEEIDQYDILNPLYIIAEQDGRHKGSMRFLPTVGRTMVNEHFRHINGGLEIRSPQIWECTRFCLSPDAPAQGKIAAKLLLAAAELGLRFGLGQSVGVFDASMERVYRRLGWSPRVIGRADTAEGQIALGLWDFSEEIRLRLCVRHQVSPREVAGWFDTAFPARHSAPATLRIA